jgi:hypothetical protein
LEFEWSIIEVLPMLNNVTELIARKGNRLEPLHEELEICKALIQDKMNEVIRLQEEITLLQDFVTSKQLNPPAPISSSAGQVFS